MAWYECLYGGGSGGTGEPDFFDSKFATAREQTYTFPQDLQYVYVCMFSNNSSLRGTYTGNGTVETIYSDSNGYLLIDKITNVKANDTFKAPGLNVSGSPRTVVFFVGKT